MIPFAAPTKRSRGVLDFIAPATQRSAARLKNLASLQCFAAQQAQSQMQAQMQAQMQVVAQIQQQQAQAQRAQMQWYYQVVGTGSGATVGGNATSGVTTLMTQMQATTSTAGLYGNAAAAATYGPARMGGHNYYARQGDHFEIKCPDGTKIRLLETGAVEVDDKDAKITYRANRFREFNKFLNASDVMEDFIKFIGAMGMAKTTLMNLPIDLFIRFLIVRAAEADGEETPAAEVLVLEDARKRLTYHPMADAAE